MEVTQAFVIVQIVFEQCRKKQIQMLAVSAQDNTGSRIKIMDFIADFFFQIVDWSWKKEAN